MALRWWADDDPTLNAGLAALWFFRGSGPVLLRDPIFLWFFRGGGSEPLSHLWIRTCECLLKTKFGIQRLGDIKFCMFVLMLNVPVNNFSVMSCRGVEPVFCLIWFFTSQSIFLVMSGFFNIKQRKKCLGQGHNSVPLVMLKLATPWSRIKYSTTAPPP